MFTGIVETVGRIVSLDLRADLARIQIETAGETAGDTSAASDLAAGLKLGDSVAVNGACLTVAQIDGSRVCFDAVRETLEKTALGALGAGDRVHLERAMRADGRFDGHIVQGHVDGQGQVRALEREGDDVRLFVDCEPAFAELLVDKGSVTLDGVSLTVVSVEAAGFDVVLIPHTLERTTLGQRRAGSPLNLEADVLGKYVKRYLERMMAAQARSASG